jgi:hypothetical protein
MKSLFACLLLLTLALSATAQKSDTQQRFFGEAILISDSLATVLIPVRYNPEHSSYLKTGPWNNHYANVLFYNIKTDTYKKLFATDTYVENFVRDRDYYNRTDNNQKNKLDNVSSRWIFYFVKDKDTNRNGKLENDDPSILYVSDREGNNLKALTTEAENAVSIEIFDKQGFALLKMQRDTDHNKSFDNKDKDFYYVRLNLSNLSLGNKIELK